MSKINSKKQYIVGIDEAGRGPVIGPLVICAYVIESENKQELIHLGVKDSKLLTRNRREELYPKLEKLAFKYKLISLSPAEIDELRKTHSLNVIEQKFMLKAVEDIFNNLSVKPSEIYIDAADVNEKRYGSAFKDKFTNAKIISKHQADKLYPVVSAASILAKVSRDRDIDKLAEKIGEDIGSGYPSDPKTKSFLKNYYAKHRKFPPYIRESWDTVKRIKKEYSDKKLTDFFKS